MASVTIPLETYDRLRENEEILKRLEGKVDFGLYEEVLLEMYEEKQEKKIDDFIEFLNDVLAESYIDYHAGRDLYPRIKFDEDYVKTYLRKFLEDKYE